MQTLDNPRMNSYLQHFGIGGHLRVDVSITMIVTSAMVTPWHTAAYLRALIRSLGSRRLVFGLPWKAINSSSPPDLKTQDTRVAKLKRSFYLLYAIGVVNASMSARGRTRSSVVFGDESPLCCGSDGSNEVASNENSVATVNCSSSLAESSDDRYYASLNQLTRDLNG